MDTGFPAPARVATNGVELAVHEAGPRDGPAVVFCHGFPELAYSWRFQVPALADAGYRAIAPDQRGYGGSSRPEAVEAYDIHQLTGDLVGLLDALDVERAVFCGHDWGGMVVWSMAQLHPDRVAGVVALNTPYSPRPPMDPIDLMRSVMGEDFYIVQFQQRGVADAIFAERVDAVFRMFYGRSEMTAEDFAKLPEEQRTLSMLAMLEAFDPANAPPPIIDEATLTHFIDVFRETGFTGGINWYRNMSRNWSTTADAPERLDIPALMISAANDVVLPPSMTDGMEERVPDLEKHVIDDCGHWTQQEKPEETNALMLDWLRRRFPA